ncbi:MAG: hypothetical protein ACIAXF_11735 [Phycisphaerales bacterium JB063]
MKRPSDVGPSETDPLPDPPPGVSAPAKFLALCVARIAAVLVFLVGLGAGAGGLRIYIGNIADPERYSLEQITRASDDLLLAVILIPASAVGFYLAEYASGSTWAIRLWQWVEKKSKKMP